MGVLGCWVSARPHTPVGGGAYKRPLWAIGLKRPLNPEPLQGTRKISLILFIIYLFIILIEFSTQGASQALLCPSRLGVSTGLEIVSFAGGATWRGLIGLIGSRCACNRPRGGISTKERNQCIRKERESECVCERVMHHSYRPKGINTFFA